MKIIKEHIPSGSYKASSKENRILQAHLGCCVGLALYDTQHKVGGIIHILLPEPPSSNPPEYPEKYATTGIPILLDALYQMGAKPETMTATIAGGALVGPVSHQDINLDIGGRSAEITEALLRSEGIAIGKSETGGFFTCTLELNLWNGSTHIRPAWESPPNAPMDHVIPTRENILRTIDTLTPIPQTALKILRIVQQDTYTIESISKELHKDQVLAARTLQMCNSAMFSGKIKIETLKDALLILGETTLIHSIITAAIENYFSQNEGKGYSLCKGGMFYHSLGCAVTAQAVAAKVEGIPPQTAYTAGLLHDIGKVVLDQYIAPLCPLFFRELHFRKTNYLDLEKKILGITHNETGTMLADAWQFSDALTSVIQHHHHPETAPKAHRKMVALIYVADMLMSRFNTGYEIDKMRYDQLTDALNELGLKTSTLPSLIDAIPLQVFNYQQTKR